mmetsp:Transcript_14978/g.36816  ORF Transcript_14978/g.36816 Transcript_14978/m.36816 type:complete len:267 (-) Transcript_14978:1027-1827(-)
MSPRNSRGSFRPFISDSFSILELSIHDSSTAKNFLTSVSFISITSRAPDSKTFAPRSIDPSLPAQTSSSNDSTASAVSPPTKYSFKMLFALSAHSSGDLYLTSCVVGIDEGTVGKLLAVETDFCLIGDPVPSTYIPTGWLCDRGIAFGFSFSGTDGGGATMFGLLPDLFIDPREGILTKPSSSTTGVDAMLLDRRKFWLLLARRFIFELAAAAASSLATSLWISSILFAVSSLRRLTQPRSLNSSRSINKNLIRLETSEECRNSTT